MFKVPVPEETHYTLKWAIEKVSILDFLVEYVTIHYPDNPEYLKRYSKALGEWKNKYDCIISKDRESLGIPKSANVIPDGSFDFYCLYNVPEYLKEDIVKKASSVGLRRKQMIESGNLADMVNPIEDVKNAAENDTRRLQNMTFQVTESCNLRCTYCYQINKSEHKMTFETAKRMVDYLTSEEYLASRPNMYGYILEFIGGEPFLEVDLIDQILDYFYDICIKRDLILAYHTRLSICSNGTLYFTKPVQEFLRKWHRTISFGISVDGNKDLHDACRVFPDGSGSYDTAMAACHDYQLKYGTLPGSKMTIAHSNIPYIRDAVISMMDEGYDEINLNCVYEDAWEPGDATKLYYQLKGLADYVIEHDRCLSYWLSIFKYDEFHPQDIENDTQNYCGGNGAMIAVDYQGLIYPCLRFMKSSIGKQVEPIVIGDIDTGIANIELYRNKYTSLLSITRQSQSDEKCMNCPIGQGCGWCTGYNYQTFGTANKRATFICQMHQARTLANGYMWNKFFLKNDMPYVFHNFIPKDWALEIIPEEEIEMIYDLEREIIFSEKNDGREINLTNYGAFHADSTDEPWMNLQPKE